jgi:hypothetical protein
MSSKLSADLLQWTGDLDALMNGRQVCAFFGGISKMTLLRWVQNPASGFPPPFKINQQNYWIRREIISFRDLQRAAGDLRRQRARAHQDKVNIVA